MIISDLNYLETVSEVPNVVGGSIFTSPFTSQYKSWLSNQPIEQIVVSENYTSTPDGKGSAYTAAGAYKDGGGFALASSYYASW